MNKKKKKEKKAKSENKLSLMDKLIIFSKEEDLDELAWLLPDGNVEKFMRKRITSTIVYTLVAALICAMFYLANELVMHYAIPTAIYLIFIVCFGFLVFKSGFNKVKKAFKKKRDAVYDSFPLWVATLQILIMTNNVTNTFKKSLPTCPECFKSDLEKFVKEIEYDPENKNSYKNFLSKYGIEEVREIIMDMYAFNRMDKNQVVHQFKILNERLNKIQNKSRERRQEQSLFFISALNSVPLMTSSIYVLVISMMLSAQ